MSKAKAVADLLTEICEGDLVRYHGGPISEGRLIDCRNGKMYYNGLPYVETRLFLTGFPLKVLRIYTGTVTCLTLDWPNGRRWGVYASDVELVASE